MDWNVSDDRNDTREGIVTVVRSVGLLARIDVSNAQLSGNYLHVWCWSPVVHMHMVFDSN